MANRDSDYCDPQAQSLARLATLQRLREQAQAGNREGMLRSIEHLIEQEARALRALRDLNDEPA